MSANKATGHTLRKARIKKGLTQVELATKASVHPNTYARIERGEQEPTFITAKKLAKALDLDISEIPA